MYFKDITDIKVRDDVTNISFWAFYYCNKTRTISIGKNVSIFDLDWTWASIRSNLIAVNIDEENKTYKVEGNGIYKKDSEGKSEELVGIFGNVTEFNIPESVKTIGKRAFSSSRITDIILPNRLQTIKDGAFSDTKITEIKIPNSVNTIEESAFASCTLLNKIEIDNTKGSIKGAPWGVPIGDRAIIWLR